jgi:Flp pilus assembly pilin Flp
MSTKKPATLGRYAKAETTLGSLIRLTVHDSSRVCLPFFQASGCGNGSAMRSALQHMRLDQGGASAVEYAMIAAFISIAAFTVIITIGTDVTSLFSQIASSF